MYRELLFLLLGWLLGLLAPAVVDGIRRRREATRVSHAIKAELQQVAFRLAGSCHLVQMRFGDVDRPYLEWFSQVFPRLPGAGTMQSVMDSVVMQLALTDEQIAEFAATQKAKENGVLTLRKYAAPLLDARVAAIWELDSELRNHLLEIRAHLDLYNDDVDNARFYIQLSFQDLNDRNREIMRSNLVGCYKSVATRSRIVIDKILAAPI